MKKETDINHKVVTKINGYEIVRSEAKETTWDGQTKGRTKVYYDVCDGEDLLESFKTLRDAKKFCNEN